MIRYEEVKHITFEDAYKGNQFSIDIVKNKYKIDTDNTPADIFQRISLYAASAEATPELQKYWAERWFDEMWRDMWRPGGSISEGSANPRKISLSNCTTILIQKDTLEAIFDAEYKTSKCAALRQGIGIEFSKVRPDQAVVRNASKVSQGPLHWMKKFDQIGEFIGQKGRKVALLFSIKIEHPNSVDFITLKNDKKSVSNANISLQISDAFMETYEKDEDWEMVFVVEDTGEVFTRTEKAKTIMRMIAQNNWSFAEPGVQFIDLMRKWSNTDVVGYPVSGTNACSEKIMPEESTCVLASYNWAFLLLLPKNIWKSALQRLACSMTRFLDNIVTLELRDHRYATELQGKTIAALREIGIGFTNLDGFLMPQGIPYDSEEGYETITTLCDVFYAETYAESQRLGEEKGNFGAFDREKFLTSPFVKQMADRYGFEFNYMRNCLTGSIAPTGSLSMTFFTPVYSWGIEPITATYYWKRQRTSGTYKWYFFVPQVVKDCLKAQGVHLPMESESIEDPTGKKGEELAKIINKYLPKDKFKASFNIDYLKKIKLMGYLSTHCIDSSISVTYNLPNNATVEQMEEIYYQAWKHGVKSVSLYRDGSRFGIIELDPPYIVEERHKGELRESDYTMEKTEKPEKISVHVLPERPVTLPCDVRFIRVKGADWVVFVGKLFDNPFEVFAGLSEEVILPKKIKSGLITKTKQGYTFETVEENEEDILKVNIQKSFKNPEQSALTRMISLSLKSGVPIGEIINQLEKSESTVVDFSKAIMRVLKEYLTEAHILEGSYKCQVCGSSNLTKLENCLKCQDCGFSGC